MFCLCSLSFLTNASHRNLHKIKGDSSLKYKTALLFFTFCTILFLSACDVKNEPFRYVDDPILFKISDKTFPSKFPATVRVDYYISNKAKNLYGKDKYIVFHWNNDVRFPYYEVYPAKKTKEGYIIWGSKYQSYTLPDPTKLGFSPVYPLRRQNGHFYMKFVNNYQYQAFMESDGIDDSNLCSYYHCFSDKKRKEK
jgi:hypothetical protein